MKGMKRCLLVMLFACCSVPQVFSQATEEEIHKEFYKSDMLISVLINYLPEGWTFTEGQGRFSITRNDSVWVLDEKWMDAPKENKESRNKRIQEKGKKLACQLIFSYEDKWTVDKIQKASILNAATMDQIRKLPEKYKIAGLKDDKLSSKQSTVYTAKTETDKKNLDKYYKEKNQLEASLQKVPDFNSEKYSLFIVSRTGLSDDMHLVYPEKASTELYTILATCREVLGK
jgi:hypothetical protein